MMYKDLDLATQRCEKKAEHDSSFNEMIIEEFPLDFANVSMRTEACVCRCVSHCSCDCDRCGWHTLNA
jgi:hypothetical protein